MLITYTTMTENNIFCIYYAYIRLRIDETNLPLSALSEVQS